MAGEPIRGKRERTLYVVAYDMSDDKRRTKVHQTLKGFGTWTEYSLFECFLTRKEFLMMRAKLDQYLDGSGDRVRIYMICETCLGKVETHGLPDPVEETMYLI